MTQTIILYIAVSRDGFITDDQGGVSWMQSTQNYGRDYEEFCGTIDTVIMGSKTYEQAISTGKWPYQGKKAFVFTKRKFAENSSEINFVPPNVTEFINQIHKDSSVKKIWLVGGAELIRSFCDNELIDEYIITTIPKDIQYGIRLPKTVLNKTSFKPIARKTYPDMVTQEHYVKLKKCDVT